MRRLVPEVVQTSGMDCGPAALKCLLEGFGIRASYGRLREACQTDVDGTSIDALEEIAGRLGLDATQVMLPVDHLLLTESGALPAIVVLRLPSGLTHFVVVWRRHGRLVQVMDPAIGRRWTTVRRLTEELYVHTQPVPAADWREWAGSDGFLAPLRARLSRLGVRADELIATALDDPTWQSLAALDAATRAAAELAGAGALPRDAEPLVLGLADDASRLPDSAWSVRPNGEALLLRGAVLVSVPARGEPDPALPPELAAVLSEPPASPARELVRLLRGDGLLRPALLALAAVAAALGVIGEALLFRTLIDAQSGDAPDAAVAALIAIGAVLLVLQVSVAGGALGVGRRLEGRLRAAFSLALPALPDRYLRSRPVSDMAERAHLIHQLRWLPELGAALVGAVVQLVAVSVAIALLEPGAALPAALATILTLVLALAMLSPLQERDLRLRNHAGALSRFALDALLGLVPLRAHSGAPAIRHEHEMLLGAWSRAGTAVVRATVTAEGLQTVVAFAFAIWIVAAHLPSDTGAALLLVYWALTLPLLAQQIGLLARQYPLHRSLTLRFLEPLGAPRETPAPPGAPGTDTAGAAISLRAVSVVAGGHAVLEDVDLEIAPGEHVAIVGSAGAGKSSLLALLLGWHAATAGAVLADGAPLTGARLTRLRSETAWIDPAVQLWNRSLEANLRYGAEESPIATGDAIADAELAHVIADLSDGLDTPLGEGGGLVSGGEGQRVRLGRALLRPRPRLALLDEPFRGLDRDQRTLLLDRVRARWRTATLLCATHDVGTSAAFARVLVVAGGRVVEDGDPAVLAAQPASHYRALLDAEDVVRDLDPSWRRLRLAAGRLTG